MRLERRRVHRFGTVALDPVLIVGVVDHEDAPRRHPVVEPAQPLRSRGVGDDQLTVGVPDVGSQVRGTARGVQPDDGRARQGGTAEPEHEIGHIVEQHPDVKRADALVTQCRRQHRARRRLAHDLIPGPVPLTGAQAEALIVEPVEQHRGDVVPARAHGRVTGCTGSAQSVPSADS